MLYKEHRGAEPASVLCSMWIAYIAKVLQNAKGIKFQFSIYYIFF